MPRRPQGNAGAEALAAEALAFLAAEPARLQRFLALTGLDPARIREVAREPAFLGAVLDHLMADQALLLLFAEESEHPVRDVEAAQARLSGPAWERDTA